LKGLLGVAGLFTLFTGVLLPIIWVWGMLSLGTSIMKRATGDCGRTYTIEQYYVYGELFCATRK